MAANLNPFEWFNDHCKKDGEVRDLIKAAVHTLEAAARAVDTKLQGLHSTPELSAATCLSEASALFAGVRLGYAALQKSFAVEDHHKFNGMWRNVTQQLCGAVALIYFCENRTLVPMSVLMTILWGELAISMEVLQSLSSFGILTILS